MPPFDNYWLTQTAIFTAIFLAAVFVSWRRQPSSGALTKDVSNELRGLAILGVVFVHLTYGRFYGTDFLFPLGIWAGPAVNLFFFLSGFGLAASAISRPRPPLLFLRQRLKKIYLPLWIFLMLILAADYMILNRQYPLAEIFGAFAGFFPLADLNVSINSPLWFLTPLVFFYLVFSLAFRAKRPLLSVLLISAASLPAFWPSLPVSSQMLEFYQAHALAFPLGVLAASLPLIAQSSLPAQLRSAASSAWRRLMALPAWLRVILLAILLALAWQTAYRSGVGRGVWLEQGYALFTMACVIVLFIFKKSRFRLLELIGIYSFEIYLLHWPLLGRYGIMYDYLPPWLATLLYLPLLLAVAYIFQRLTVWLEDIIFSGKKIPN